MTMRHANEQSDSNGSRGTLVNALFASQLLQWNIKLLIMFINWINWCVWMHCMVAD